MRRYLRRILAFFFLFVSFLCLGLAAATACVLLPLPTVLDAYEEADVVITARVVSIEKTNEPDPIHLNIRSATMLVQKVFKGNVKVQDAISFAQGNGIDCLWLFDEKMIGSEYLEKGDVGERSQFLDKKGGFKFESVSAGRYKIIVHEDKLGRGRLTQVSYYDPQKSQLLTTLIVNIKHGESMRGLKIIVPTMARGSSR